MAYFKTIVTKQTTDRSETAGRDHDVALNAYLKKGDGSQREVKEMSSYATTNVAAGEIHLFTTLCCEGEEY